MTEDLVDLWSFGADACDARCITTNGFIKTDGRAVMGRGVALEACQRYIALRAIQGRALQTFGNVPTILLPDHRPVLVSFPVKHHWKEWADLALIAESARRLVILANEQRWQRIVLPRPGCHNGHRSWEREVRSILRPMLDDRFTVVSL